MANITLNDIKLFLSDLLAKRSADLLLLSAGKTYLKLFMQRQEQIQALPDALLSRPLADILADTDSLHDNYGRALWHFSEGYKFLPGIEPRLLSVIEKIQETFIPALDILRARYQDEAARAKEVRPRLNEMESDLRRFPVLADKTLFHVAEGFIENGEKLGSLLSSRADVTSTSNRSGAGKLLSSTLGLIRRVRDSLPDEREANPQLPADIETRLFGYLDLLAKARAEGAPPPPPPATSTAAQETPGKD